MERPKRPYSLQKRPTKKPNRFIYYVKFRDPDSGKYLSAVSSGMTSKVNAANWADTQIRNGKVRSFAHGRITFESLAKGFWDFENSAYIQGRLARGDSLSRGYAAISEGYCRKYLIPAFGKTILDLLKPVDIERWIISLGREHSLSSASVNRVYTCFRVMVREAIRLGYLEHDPTRQVRLVREDVAEKGILTVQEVRQLFGSGALEKYWGGDHVAMTANALAAATGLRLGEVRGLTLGCLYADRLEILYSWEEGYGLKEPKRGSRRTVPITASLYGALHAIAVERELCESDELVFCGKTTHEAIPKWRLPTRFQVALEEMKISKEAQKARGITFHSWRHFFNSLIRGQLPDEKLRLLTGHRSAEMTEHYSHALPEDLTKVRAVQEQFISVPLRGVDGKDAREA